MNFLYLCNMYKYFSNDRTKARLFMRFLKREGIYTAFRTNFMAKNAVKFRCDPHMPIAPYPGGLICYGFSFQLTPQGHDFWHDMHMKWYDYLFQN